MNATIAFPPSMPALLMSEEASLRTEPSLRQRTEAVFQHSSTELLALFDALPLQENKDARHHFRVQQIAFEVQNEQLRQMLAAKTVDGHFALCVCGGACTALPS